MPNANSVDKVPWSNRAKCPRDSPTNDPPCVCHLGRRGCTYCACHPPPPEGLFPNKGHRESTFQPDCLTDISCPFPRPELKTSVMASAAGRLPKPKLRGLASAYVTKTIPVSIVGGLIAAAAWKWGYAEPSKRRYAEFYS